MATDKNLFATRKAMWKRYRSEQRALRHQQKWSDDLDYGQRFFEDDPEPVVQYMEQHTPISCRSYILGTLTFLTEVIVIVLLWKTYF